MPGFDTSFNATAGVVPADDPIGAQGEGRPADGSGQEQLSTDRAAGVIANALDAFAHWGSADQLRGYANEAIGETKVNVGLAVGSPELTLAGIAQKALGQAQRYIGEAKGAIEVDLASEASVTTALDSPKGDTAGFPEDHLGI